MVRRCIAAHFPITPRPQSVFVGNAVTVGGRSQKAIAKAMRDVICVITKAMGHAIRNCFGQADSHAGPIPMPMADMMPDMDAAIMQVIRIWAIKRVFLSIISFSRATAAGNGRIRTPNSTTHIRGWCRGFVPMHDWITLTRGPE